MSLLAVQALPAQAQDAQAPGDLAQAVNSLSQAVDDLSQAADDLERAVSAPAQAETGAYLQQIRQLSDEALKASRAAEQAESVDAVKRYADAVFTLVWGAPSGLAGENARGAAHAHGWKTRWQTTPAAFDSSFAARYGTAPPEITDPTQLGIVGRGRYVRKQLQAILDDPAASEEEKQYAEGAIASLNNVIGWMKMDDGVTKGERQPRVDLTREWDAPSTFWNSTADTGWLHEVHAQALNILKTDYEGNLAMAQRHAADLTALVRKYLEGVDADEDGAIEPVMMEGGLNTLMGMKERGMGKGDKG